MAKPTTTTTTTTTKPQADEADTDPVAGAEPAEQPDSYDEAIVGLLVKGRSPAAAATALHLPVVTIYRRLADVHFGARVAVARCGRWVKSPSAWRADFLQCVTNIRTVRDSPDGPLDTRRRAAARIAELALRLAGITDTDVRRAVLEQVAADFAARN